MKILRNNLMILVYIIIVIIVIALSMGLTYLIATSDLPDWLKFWLLK